MIKTIIYRLEGVIINQELIRFKAYEKLWVYMRYHPEWQNFENILRLREMYLRKRGSTRPYDDIASRHLDERQLNRFREEWKLFYRKMSDFYVRAVPGMIGLNKKLNYYYKTALIANKSPVFEKAKKKFGLEFNFNHIMAQNYSLDESTTVTVLQEILRRTKSNPEETILISERLFPDISAARRLGIHTIYTKFDTRTKGFTPQSYREREYVASLDRVPERLPALRQAGREPEAVAQKPLDLEKIIARMEEGKELREKHQPQEETGNVSLWDIAREILNIPNFDK